MIGIYYIAIGSYIKMFDGFMGTLHNFLPGEEKEVVLLTDCKTFDAKAYNGVRIVPWHAHFKTTILLEKMLMIQQDLETADYEEAYFVNANIRFLRTTGRSILSKDRLNVARHYLCRHNDTTDWFGYTFNIPESRRTFADLSMMQAVGLVPKNYREAKYFNAGFFGGRKDTMLRMCKDVNSLLDEALAKNYMPIWHDESAYNKWVNAHTELVNVLDASVYSNDGAPCILYGKKTL